jgi:hypothetical protein
MKTIYRFLCVLTVTFASAMVGLAQDSPATTRGKAIGETINAAINAAIPGANAIGSLIQTLLGNKNEKKISKDDLDKALMDQADKLQKQAQDQLKSLSSVVAEITAANDLANTSQIAYESMTIARSFVTLQSDTGWDAFKTQWEKVAKPTLDNVKKFDPAKLGKISNEDIHTEWQRLMGQYQQLITDVETFSGQKNVALVIPSLDQLRNLVNTLATIPSVELRAFSTQLAGLANAGGTRVPPPPPDPTKPETLRSFLDQLLAK